MSPLSASQCPPSLCDPFTSALPIDHAAISTLGAPFEIETICSSSPLAAQLDELQLDYGVGPCWSARTTRSPVLLPDLERVESTRWPLLQAAIALEQIRAAYAFPLITATLDIGVVDLYAFSPDALSAWDVAEAARLADETAWRVLRRSVAHRNDATPEDPSARRTVHQATGMVVAQLRIPPEDALLVLRAHAFATAQTVRDVAVDIIDRRLDFSG